MALTQPNDDTNINPPMNPSPDLATEDMEGRLGGTSDLESHAGPRMNPMLPVEHGMPDEPPSPQGPPPDGKQRFHNTMADFEHRAEANRAAMIGLDPEDPQFRQKMSDLQAQHGSLTTEKARYQMLHPWGGPESAHPGVLGKIGHVAGKIGEIAGGAIAPGVVQAIPGTQANLAAKGNAGEAETKMAGEEGQKAALAGEEAAAGKEAEARIPAIEAGTEHTKQETENLKNPPAKVGATPEETTLHDLMTGENGNPRINPATGKPYSYLEAFQETQGAIQGAKPERTKTPEEQFIEDFFKRTPGATMADAVRAYAQASQRPERPGAGTARGDKSYQYNQGRLDKIRQPIDQTVARFSRLQDTLNQHDPQADALVGPELLTVMAGGQGSGLRMNEAEISRIVGGRSAWENLRGAIQHWNTDPKSARSITPEQDKQLRALIQVVGTKLTSKQQILEQAQEQLLGSDDPQQHRQIMADAQKKLDGIDAGHGGTAAPAAGNGQMVRARDPQGKLHEAPAGTALPQGWKAE